MINKLIGAKTTWLTTSIPLSVVNHQNFFLKKKKGVASSYDLRNCGRCNS